VCAHAGARLAHFIGGVGDFPSRRSKAGEGGPGNIATRGDTQLGGGAHGRALARARGAWRVGGKGPGSGRDPLPLRLARGTSVLGVQAPG
jgi:hypothetical protein